MCVSRSCSRATSWGNTAALSSSSMQKPESEAPLSRPISAVAPISTDLTGSRGISQGWSVNAKGLRLHDQYVAGNRIQYFFGRIADEDALDHGSRDRPHHEHLRLQRPRDFRQHERGVSHLQMGVPCGELVFHIECVEAPSNHGRIFPLPG